MGICAMQACWWHSHALPNASDLAEKNDRHKGKQFQTNPSKRTDGGVGFFAKKTYTPEVYNDRLST